MGRFFEYATLLVVGLSGTTVAAAVVGQPIPVVLPAVGAGLLVAVDHVRRNRADRADAAVLDDDRADDPGGQPDTADGFTNVFTDGGTREGDR